MKHVILFFAIAVLSACATGPVPYRAHNAGQAGGYWEKPGDLPGSHRVFAELKSSTDRADAIHYLTLRLGELCQKDKATHFDVNKLEVAGDTPASSSYRIYTLLGFCYENLDRLVGLDLLFNDGPTQLADGTALVIESTRESRESNFKAGDVLLSLDGQRIHSLTEYRLFLFRNGKTGQAVSAQVLRGGKPVSVVQNYAVASSMYGPRDMADLHSWLENYYR